MSKIHARFYVAQFNKTATAQPTKYAQVVLNAVTRKTDDNVEWAKYTPSGEIKLSVSTETGAYDLFEAALGKDIAITFDVIED